MKLLMINQHASNHGDEAAGKALIRAIRAKGFKEEINILYNTKTNYDNEYLNVDSSIKNNEYQNLTKIDKILILLTFLLPFFFIKKFFSKSAVISKEFQLINQSDYIIGNPGGVNIGPYKDWRYLWRLFVAIKLHKNVSIYSISFGPIPANYLFKKTSLFVLKNANFLSLRDKKSQRFAKELNIDFTSSIDTAFLNNQPYEEIPLEVCNKLEKKYVIVVPNELYKWHPLYMNLDKEKLNKLYIRIINYFTLQNIQVVLLPQMYGTENDSNYFKKLKERSENSDKIIIIDSNYSVDIQQQIVSKADFLIGARYHTIIFSINNNKPFLSLAYEHKMTNTLETLNLSDNNFELHNILDEKVNIIHELNQLYLNKDNIGTKVKESNLQANKIANETFGNFYHTVFPSNF